jgi:hypothetical protein
MSLVLAGPLRSVRTPSSKFRGWRPDHPKCLRALARLGPMDCVSPIERRAVGLRCQLVLFAQNVAMGATQARGRGNACTLALTDDGLLLNGEACAHRLRTESPEELPPYAVRASEFLELLPKSWWPFRDHEVMKMGRIPKKG